MTKDEFLRLLDRKLDVINERERRDIIDEYRTHIEMKMKEGKSEEEAIEDFGNIDELVDDILDAYKINTDRVNRSFDTKLNRFMDDLFNGFQRFLGSFTSLHIPFRMISSLGSSLLHSVAGFGIGSLLAAIWKFIIGVAYVAIFVVLLVNLCTKRLNRYRSHSRNGEGASVFDDFKESFDFDQAKKTVHSFTNDRSTRRETVYDERDDIKYQERDTQRGETDDEYEDESMYEEPRRREYRRSYEGDHMERGVTSVATILMRIFFCLMMIPFVGIIVALCCALGAMIVLSFEGLTLFGAYFIVIGALVATGGFLSLLYSVLWRRG